MQSPFEAVEAEGLGFVVDDIVEVDIVDDDTKPTINTIHRRKYDMDLLVELGDVADDEADAAPFVSVFPFPDVLPVSPLPLLPTGD